MNIDIFINKVFSDLPINEQIQQYTKNGPFIRLKMYIASLVLSEDIYSIFVTIELG